MSCNQLEDLVCDFSFKIMNLEALKFVVKFGTFKLNFISLSKIVCKQGMHGTTARQIATELVTSFLEMF